MSIYINVIIPNTMMFVSVYPNNPDILIFFWVKKALDCFWSASTCWHLGSLSS